MPLKCKKCGKCHTARYDCQAVTVAAPSTSQRADVGCSAWVEELAKSWERRADVMDEKYTGDFKTLARVLFEQSFRDRAEELRRAYAKSSSTGLISDLDQQKNVNGGI